MKELKPLRPNSARCRVARAGFSLLELLAVAVVLVILTTLMWGSGSPSQQKKQALACQGNLQKIYLAAEIYARDHSGQFPLVSGAKTSEEPLSALIPRYTSDNSVFICPGSKDSTLRTGDPLL